MPEEMVMTGGRWYLRDVDTRKKELIKEDELRRLDEMMTERKKPAPAKLARFKVFNLRIKCRKCDRIMRYCGSNCDSGSMRYMYKCHKCGVTSRFFTEEDIARIWARGTFVDRNGRRIR